MQISWLQPRIHSLLHCGEQRGQYALWIIETGACPAGPASMAAHWVSQLVSKQPVTASLLQPATNQPGRALAWPFRLTQQDVSHNVNRERVMLAVELIQSPAVVPAQLQAHRMNVSSMVVGCDRRGVPAGVQVPAGGGKRCGAFCGLCD